MTVVSRYKSRCFSNRAARPMTSEKNTPRYTKKIPKRIETHAESDPDYENRKKVKSKENIHISYVFTTSGNRFSTPYPSRNVVISNFKSDAGIELPQAFGKWVKCSKTCSKGGPWVHQKSMIIQPWLLGCPLCWPSGPLNPENVDSGWQKWVCRLQNHFWNEKNRSSDS